MLLFMVVSNAYPISLWAHPQIQDAMWVRFDPGRIRVALNSSLREIILTAGLKERGAVGNAQAGSYDPEELRDATQRHGAYLLSHLNLVDGSSSLSGKVVHITPPTSIGQADTTFCQYELEYLLNSPWPSEILFSQNMLTEWPYGPSMPWDISYIVQAKPFESPDTETRLLGFEEPLILPTGLKTGSAKPSTVRNWVLFKEYVRHGIDHILGGVDHLFFLAALVIATAGLWEMAEVILVFTLAHTLTLTLSVLGIIRIPPSVVEPLIALSIIVVAIDNMIYPGKAHSRLRLAVAFGFGLVHGLGFAGGVLSSMSGLSGSGLWAALTGFTMGIEIGNQAVAMPLFLLLVVGRRFLSRTRQQSLVITGSVLIAGGGIYFLVVALKQQLFR